MNKMIMTNNSDADLFSGQQGLALIIQKKILKSLGIKY